MRAIPFTRSRGAINGDDWRETRKGTYYCKKCGSPKVLNDDTDVLPPCSKCNGTEFTP